MRSIPAGEFKAKCLAILDEVNSTGEPVLITKRGKPVARVDVPYESKSEPADSIFGCLRHMATIQGDLVASEFTDDEWERFANDSWPGAKSGPDR